MPYDFSFFQRYCCFRIELHNILDKNVDLERKNMSVRGALLCFQGYVLNLDMRIVVKILSI